MAEEATTKRVSTKTTGGSVVRRVIFGVLALLVCAYGVGVWWFGSHWVPGATVNGLDVSGFTDDEAAALLAGEAGDWRGSVTSTGGFSLELTGEDVGLAVDGITMAADARSRENAWLWPWLVANPPEISEKRQASIDAEKVAAVVDAAVASFNETAAEPTDASIAFDEGAAAYVIAPGSLGTRLDAEAVRAVVVEMAASLEESRELEESTLAAPALSEEDEALVAARDAANALVGHSVTFVWDEEEVARLEAAQLREWVSFDEGWQPVLDEEALREWLDESCSEDVWHQDDLHYYGLDLDQAVEDVSAALAGETGDAEVQLADEVTEDKPPLSKGASSRGRHLDVNLTTQYARFYDSNSNIIWESYIVSGNTSNGHDTPTGDFSIQNKQRARTLIGADENHDGEPDYRTYVEYWMLFRSGGYGLHDAPWRSSFGGDIYTYDGSHGCVNLPPERAAELYGIVKVGDRVYVHW